MKTISDTMMLVFGLSLSHLKTVESARISKTKMSKTVNTLCPPRGEIPAAPMTPFDHNGVSWPAYCFEGEEEEHLFILGDWGGLYQNGKVYPAPNLDPKKQRVFQHGIDNQAQQLVAQQMERYAASLKPRLVLNGGDNFYWGGITEECGKPMQQAIDDFSKPEAVGTLQIKNVFEDMYTGALKNTPFLLCFGNHDYGGFGYHSAWDQQIAYTWSNTTSRWVLPGQYWHQRINYPSKDTTVDVLMVDTCNQDTCTPTHDQGHNICSHDHNQGKSCPHGPQSPTHCVEWFASLWKREVDWMEQKLCGSDADWKIIVTHFPPEDNTHQPAVKDWTHLRDKCGIDFYVGSHRHSQEMHTASWMIPYVVAGGGGGVTSERNSGDNTQYGFFDLLVQKDNLTVTSYNQFGRKTGGMVIAKRQNAHNHAYMTAGDPELPEYTRRRRSGGYRRRRYWR